MPELLVVVVVPDGDALEVPVLVPVPDGDALVVLPVVVPPGPTLLLLEVLLLIMLTVPELLEPLDPPGALDVAVLEPVLVLTVLSLLLEVGVVCALVSDVPVYTPFEPKV